MKRSPIEHFLPPELVKHLELDRRQNGQGLVPLEKLLPRPQPRRRFEEASLQALAESVRAHGVLEPLLVRPLRDGRYEVIAGERRLRAAALAGLREVPVVVLEVDERAAAAIALVENLQREDLNPFEETVALLDLLALELGQGREEAVALLHRMRDEKRGKVPRNVAGSRDAAKVEEVFRRLGRMGWEGFVRHRLPLLNLPPDLQEALLEGSIPYTAALELKKVGDPSLRQALLEEAKAGLSLRELRARIRQTLKPAHPPTPYRELLRRLSRLDLQGLPPEVRAEVEGHLRALAQRLGIEEKEGGVK